MFPLLVWSHFPLVLSQQIPLLPQAKPHNLFPPAFLTALRDTACHCGVTSVLVPCLQYDKEIRVINTATAACSIPSKRRADLPLTAGEQLDVIDVTEGSAVICRNSEGRCKSVETLCHRWSAFNPVLRSKLTRQIILCVLCWAIAAIFAQEFTNLLFSPFSQMGMS